jgi:soluble lytic murein transglycosylase-like protein
MTVAGLAASSGVRALGGALLHSTWQCALVAGALWLALGALPRTRSSARYAACSVALVTLIVLPVATFALRLLAAPVRSPTIVSAGAMFYEKTLLGLSLAWASGCSVMSLRVAFGVSQLRGLVRRAEALTEPWLGQLARLLKRVGVRQQVRLLGSTEIDAPMMLGWLRPVILVPLGAVTSLPAAYLEALLVHELAHIRRRDFVVNAVQVCVETALFYHPGARWVSNRMRIEREFCCDDLVIRITGERLDYARALAALEEWRAPATALALASNAGSLVSRIEHIVQSRRPSRVARRSLWAAVGVLGCALGLSSAGVWASVGREPAPMVASALGIPWLPPGLKRWEPEFTEVAARYDVPAALVAIIALIESQGDPSARSPGGAIGLMQLLPSTAAAIAAQRELGSYSEARLWDPAYNVDFGAWYLSRQLATFGTGTMDAAIGIAAVAYNGGPQLTRRYLAGTSELPEPVVHYRDLALGLWKERAQQHSPTYSAWLSSIAPRGAALAPQ